MNAFAIGGICIGLTALAGLALYVWVQTRV